MSNVRERIVSYVDRHKAEWEEIALAIHAKPEVSNYEFFASETLSNKLKENGFEVELPAAGHRTGFAASYKSQKPGPVICFLAEYRALVGLGHGCGSQCFRRIKLSCRLCFKKRYRRIGRRGKSVRYTG